MRIMDSGPKPLNDFGQTVQYLFVLVRLPWLSPKKSAA